jgi:hypothetical protein
MPEAMTQTISRRLVVSPATRFSGTSQPVTFFHAKPTSRVVPAAAAAPAATASAFHNRSDR